MSEILATRVTEPVVEVKENDTPGIVTDTTLEATEKPLEVLDKPFVTELLELGESLNHFDMKKLSNEIDGYVKEELSFKDIKLSRESYKELVDSYLSRLKLPDGVSVYTKVEQLHKLLGINCKLLQAAKEKQEFLQMSPSDMTSVQLKRYLNETI